MIFRDFHIFSGHFEKSEKYIKSIPNMTFSPLLGSSLADKKIVSIDEHRTYGRKSYLWTKIVPTDDNPCDHF